MWDPSSRTSTETGRVGDEVSVKTPGGVREFEIIGITVQEED
ncbi:MAG: hypothetical protein NTY86_02740 [Deltaproteobacteria bacterium]|nr:hypothetical protein [Deltaproteobacteria bacterium]